jgi:hypothetical protein
MASHCDALQSESERVREEKVMLGGVSSDTLFKAEGDRKLFAVSRTLTARPSHQKNRLESGKTFGNEEG